MARRLDALDASFGADFHKLLYAKREEEEDVAQVVRGIIADVRARGDAALIELTNKFDRAGVSKETLKLSAAEIDAGLAKIDKAQLAAIETAAARIESYHKRQLPEDLRYTDDTGALLGWRWTSVDSVGLYVPGGTASYPSSVLMNAIPARVAGVARIVMVTPASGGKINPLVLAAARRAGVTDIYRIGGAQAVAALAYGTEAVMAVDKIVGPGNAYVAAAKRAVFGQVGIDSIAGPSEIVVICDGLTDPRWIAMDLFSQAEHDEDAQAILISPDAAFLDRVAAAMRERLGELPRAAIIEASLKNRGALIAVSDLAEAVRVSNRIAPEHLELSVAAPRELLPSVRHAGAVFLGRHAPEAFGDYCAGPNHVLPTSRAARFSSPLGVYEFQKRSSLIECTVEGARALSVIAGRIADAEGLQAHAASARDRGLGER